jgi:hypothetical protein
MLLLGSGGISRRHEGRLGLRREQRAWRKKEAPAR